MDDAEVARIDGILEQWRQGDVFLEESQFVHIADCTCPLTEEAAGLAEAAAAQGYDAGNGEVVTTVLGFAVLTQTCDLVLPCRDLPFVEVAPLVRVQEEDIRFAKKGMLVRRAYIPGIAEHHLLVDLERTMTIEKAVLAQWHRNQGCVNDADARSFASALARKRARPAFPNDFVEAIRPLQRRIKEKHGKMSDEGQLLAHLREIRVMPVPAWNHNKVNVRFLFIKESDPEGLATAWYDFVGTLIGRVQPAERFSYAPPEVAGLSDYSAQDYVESDRLDLDYISDST